MKLVEVICGYTTSDVVTNTIVQLSKILGKLPINVNDCIGFADTRILIPVINEGFADINEIDSVMKLVMTHPINVLE
jgi:3-hydroxybutyryl-CoA dehydrogenase